MNAEQDEKQALRAKRIGSSDAAAAIGLNPYYTAVELWMEKRGELPVFEGNAPTKWGLLLEPVVRQEYAERTARVVRLPPEPLIHPTVPYVVCHPDGITDDRRLYEGKTAGYPKGWGDEGTDQVPEQYLIQVQHAMMVTALTVADIAVLIGGQDFRIYTIKADRGLQDAILLAEQEFWHHLQSGTRPPLDHKSQSAINVLKKLYPGTNGQTLQATPEMQLWRNQIEAAKGQKDCAAALAAEAKAQLLDFMGEASILRFSDGRSFRRKTIDRKAYAVEATSYMDARWIGGK